MKGLTEQAAREIKVKKVENFLMNISAEARAKGIKKFCIFK